MKQLTFDGVNDLFQHPRWGAVTKEHAAYLDTLKPAKKIVYPKIIPMSEAMSIRNDRFIDTHGFSLH